jgi:hypothetical protein
MFLLMAGIASPGRAMVIAPARTEIHLAPGLSTQVFLTATNDDKFKVQVDVTTKDWFVLDANKALTSDKWIKIHGPTQFNLNPGKSRKVKLTLSCPKETVGELVGMVSFRYQTEHPSMVTPMISVSMYVMAAGQEKIEGIIKDISAHLWNGHIAFGTVVENTGNIHLRPSGRLVVVDSKGVELSSMAVPEGQPTYPGRDGIYSVQTPSNMQFSSGTYTVRAELGYKDLILKKSREFTVLPDGQVQMSPIK